VGIKAKSVLALALAGILGWPGPAGAIKEATVGNTTLVVKTVTTRTLSLKDDIYHNELIQTFEESATELTFLDQTSLSLGPQSRITLDRFIYDPDPSKSSFVLTVTQGALRFASGALPDESYVIHTPVATIGIRGTVIDLVVERTGAGDSATNVNLTVIEGEARVLNCSGIQVLVPSGQSSTVWGQQDGGCSDPTEPGPRPERFAKVFDHKDRIILNHSGTDFQRGMKSHLAPVGLEESLGSAR
jgi:hypothetical protein